MSDLREKLEKWANDTTNGYTEIGAAEFSAAMKMLDLLWWRVSAGDELDRCSSCDMRLDDCTCDWLKAQPKSAPDWRDAACENIERALARAPREWWITSLEHNDDGPDVLIEGPNAYYVHVIEHSAYTALERECAELRATNAQLKETATQLQAELIQRVSASFKLQAELAAEKGQTERLRAEHHFVVQAGQRLREERDRLRAAVERWADEYGDLHEIAREALQDKTKA